MNLTRVKRQPNELSRMFREFEPLGRWMEDLAGWKLENRLPAAFQEMRIPAVDVAETPTEYQVLVELPGLEEKDIQIEVMGDNLCISGERKWEEEKKSKEFLQVETQYGSFRRDLRLPSGLRTRAEDIKATYKNGVLDIKIPKVEPTPAAKVQVKKG